MQYSKSNILKTIGVLFLLFLIGMSYLNNQFFLDKIIVCSLILALVLFAKTRGEHHKTTSTWYSDKDATNSHKL